MSKAPDTRRRHAEDFKLALVRRSLEPDASVAAIAQEARVNANLLFRNNYLFMGSDAGGKRAAAMYSLVKAKLNGVDPQAYLREVFERIG